MGKAEVEIMRKVLILVLIILLSGCGPAATPTPLPPTPMPERPAPLMSESEIPAPPRSVKLTLEELPLRIREEQRLLRERELAVVRRDFPDPIREYFLSEAPVEELKAFYQRELPPGWEPDTSITMRPVIEEPDVGAISFYFKKSVGGQLFSAEVHLHFSAEYGWEEFDGPWRGKVFVIILQKRVILGVSHRGQLRPEATEMAGNQVLKPDRRGV